MRELREFEDWLDVCPWRSDRVMLLMVNEGEVPQQASSRREKLDMLNSGEGQIFVIWPGQWSSSARLIPETEIANVWQKVRG